MVSYANSSGSDLLFTVEFENDLGRPLHIQDFDLSTTSLTTGGTYRSTGNCTPEIAPVGSPIICSAVLNGSVNPSPGSYVTNYFTIHYSVCNDLDSCQTSNATYMTTGSSQSSFQASPQALYFISLLTENGTGYIVLDGIRYPSGTDVPLLGNSHSVHIVPPTGYELATWNGTNITVHNSTSQDTTITLSSNGMLMAYFQPATSTSTSTSVPTSVSTSVSTTSTGTSTSTSISTSTTTSTSTSISTTVTTTIPAAAYVYCAAGVISPSTKAAYYSPLTDNVIGTWRSTTSYPIKTWGNTCDAYNGYIYCVGDASYSGKSYYAPLSNNGIGTWTQTSSMATAQIPCMAYGGYLYCVVDAYTGIHYAPISSSGIGTWQTSAPYPNNANLFSCASYNGYIYCIGGSVGYTAINGTTLKYAYYINASGGSVGTWHSTTQYPINVSMESCTAYNGYIYCVGGSTGNSNGTANYMETNSSYYAPVSSSGIGTWAQGPAYPGIAFEGGQCIAYGGHIYCLGGGGTSTYYAPISSSGIGTWQQTTSYPLWISDSKPCVISPP